jgi:Cu/Ag efflux pump CusA
VFWYTIESADKKLSAMDLRTLQDWNVRLILRTAPGSTMSPPGAATRSSSRC